jgi:hypothetical protein
MDSEDVLQIYIHTLETFTSKYGLKISTGTTTTMAFKGRDPVRSKIAINDNIIEHINTFTYPDWSISYRNEKGLTVKISTFLPITGIINRDLNPSPVQKPTRLKIYNIFAFRTFYTDAKCVQLGNRINAG